MIGRHQGWRLPAEWEPRRGSLLAWPAWEGRAQPGIEALYVRLIGLLRAVEPVHLLVAPDDRRRVATLLGGEDESLRIEPLLCNDIWMRDAGPISVLDRAGNTLFLDGNFNGWGGRYPHELDALLPLVLARRWHRPRQRLAMCLEGGAIEVNGAGLGLTTTPVLGNANRVNPPPDQIEAELADWLGIDRLLWLPHGLSMDHTDGHIDNLVRFVDPKRLVCCMAGPDHPDAAALADNRAVLEQALDPNLELIDLPTPVVQSATGQALPASHANFYLAPGLVLMPCFGQNTDDEAKATLQSLFPQHRVLDLDCRPVLAHGGGVHCMIQPLQGRIDPETRT
ncbi:MAG: agmatine deiminase family protein [Wenzhouxiangella sp.]|nr:MAG: agmatine deiminase family protein [Wenzhouxiangella sp.]